MYLNHPVWGNFLDFFDVYHSSFVHRLESIVADANLDLELLGNSSSLRSQVQFGKGQFSMILHVILFLQKKILWNRFANCYFEEKRIVFHGDQNSFVIRHPSCLDEGNLKMSLFLVTKGSSISSLTCVFLFKGFVYLWGHWLSMSCVYGFLVIIGQFIRSRSDLVSALTCNTKNIIWIFGAKNKRCMMHFDAKWLSGSSAINHIFFHEKRTMHKVFKN